VKPLPYRIVKRKLESLGFVEVSQNGSHVKFVKITGEGTRTAIVPKHKEIAAGALRSILRQVGLSESEFEKM